MWRITVAPMLVLAVAVIGACTQRVTRDDVKTAQHNVDQQTQELRDAQAAARDNVEAQARRTDDARHEALKPPTVLDPLTKANPTVEEQKLIDAQRDANDKIRKEARDVADAQRDLLNKEIKLSAEENRKETQRQADRLTADADQMLSDLKTRSANAPEDGALKTKIKDVQARRDRVQEALKALNNANDANRAAAESEASAALADLSRELGTR